MGKMDEDLKKALVELREEDALELADEMLAGGIEPLHIVDVAREALNIVGERYERREYFLSALIMSGEIFRGIVAMLEDSFNFPKAEGEARRVVLGAPLGDVHDIGKDIVAILLRCHGFEVVDLGVSVSPEAFVDAAKQTGARLVAMSTLITIAYDAIKETVDSFERAGIRGDVKIILGGGAISRRVCDYTGADDFGEDAMDAVRFAERFA
jgi:methylmalonyl-CoA mutase cobalamin-binding domain/chain